MLVFREMQSKAAGCGSQGSPYPWDALLQPGRGEFQCVSFAKTQTATRLLCVPFPCVCYSPVRYLLTELLEEKSCPLSLPLRLAEVREHPALMRVWSTGYSPSSLGVVPPLPWCLLLGRIVCQLVVKNKLIAPVP